MKKVIAFSTGFKKRRHAPVSVSKEQQTKKGKQGLAAFVASQQKQYI